MTKASQPEPSHGMKTWNDSLTASAKTVETRSTAFVIRACHCIFTIFNFWNLSSYQAHLESPTIWYSWWIEFGTSYDCQSIVHDVHRIRTIFHKINWSTKCISTSKFFPPPRHTPAFARRVTGATTGHGEPSIWYKYVQMMYRYTVYISSATWHLQENPPMITILHMDQTINFK